MDALVACPTWTGSVWFDLRGQYLNDLRGPLTYEVNPLRGESGVLYVLRGR